MNRPNNIVQYDELDLKLGIKSSLPHVKSTLALAVLLWECSGKSVLIYSEQDNDSIVMTGELSQKVADKLSEICKAEKIDSADLISIVNENPLFKSQMEALIVAFELVWKLAKVSFVEENKPASSERTGGTRYPKKLEYSISADIIHSIIESNPDSYLRILLSWVGFNINIDSSLENHLLHLFTALAEGAVFKLTDGDKDVIFNQGSLYSKVLETQGTADINGDKEAKGSLRILKSLLSDGLNPYLAYSGGNVTVRNGKTEELEAYQARVDTFHRLSATKVIGLADNDIQPEPTTINSDKQKAKFKAWLGSQKKANGDPYSSNTVDSYISNMGRGYNEFEKYKGYDSVFQIQDSDELKEYTDYLFNEPGFDDFNDRAENKACSCGLAKYDEFLNESIELPEIRFQTGLKSRFYSNRIFFGAPGTGKSFTLNKERKELLGEDNDVDYERVTFHPDYSYANFVGTYKPVPSMDSKGEDVITYEYVPGPFMRIYVEALKNGRTDDVRPFLLIVEEINRANVAAVFGDIFQLLDRDDDAVSEYPIQTSEDIKKYLAKELGGNPEKYTKIKLPDNMFIWSTMNSADQGVFPMDTAFKRRWDFTYLGIDDSEKNLIGKTVILGEEHTKHRIEWNKLRKAINKFLAKNKINEDKQLGPYFIPKRIVIPANGNEIDREAFISTFKNKVIMYLFEDAAKQKRSTLFEGCFDNSNRYSEICKEFDIKGIGIFNSEIQNTADPTDLPLISENEESTVEENGE